MVKKLIQKLKRAAFGRRPQAPDKETPHESTPARTSSGERVQRQSTAAATDDNAWTIDDFQIEPSPDRARFHDFGLPLPVLHAIQDLGFEYCTPIQAKVLAHVREGRNIAGRAQTGTGKTAAFLMCIFARFIASPRSKDRKRGAPRALILAPTRELVLQIAKDAQDLSKYSPIHCIAVYGGMDFEKQRKEIENRHVDLIAATPGRLLDFVRRGILDLKQVEVLVIDEADRMLDMGFIPDVSRIIRATPPKDKRRTMLFSATLTEKVLRLASQWMPDPVICEIEPEKVTVDIVDQIVYIVQAREKFRLLYNLLQKEDASKILIFCNRRTTTQRLAENLRKHGVPCEYLSGVVRQEKRLRILEEFREGKIRIVVATDVAGRGLHVDNISHVVNYEFPYEPEDYVHRIGRTGRAGVFGTAISFACEEESFVIPEIEEYIGKTLSCTMPKADLLAAPPRPTGGTERAPQHAHTSSSRRSGQRQGGSGGRRRPR